VNQAASTTQRNPRGCLFYALVFGSVIGLLLLLGMVAGYYSLRKAVDTLTERSPAPLPAVRVSDAEALQIQKRVDGFRETVRARLPTPPLVMTDREINALIATSPEFKHLRDKVHVKIEDGQVRGQISLPLDNTGVGFLKGRYLNGEAAFRIRLQEEGLLKVSLAEVTVKGKPLPKRWMSRIRSVNLAGKLNEDPQTSTALATLHSIESKDNQLILVPNKPE
jgi:hypothetical protein